MLANELIAHSRQAQMTTKTMDMPSGYVDDWHEHPWHQIIYPVRGLLQSSIGDKNFIIPHNSLLFVPAFYPHKSIAITNTTFLAIYLNPAHSVTFETVAKSCLMTPFLKELVLMLREQDYPESMLMHLMAVLNDQIRVAKSFEIPLLLPTDKRLNTIFSRLQKQPTLDTTLEEWATIVGASARTLSRLLSKEFKMSFSLWRQHIRLVLSLPYLDTSLSLQQIAFDFGYQSDSAYIHAFRKMFRLTPSQYRKKQITQS